MNQAQIAEQERAAQQKRYYHSPEGQAAHARHRAGRGRQTKAEALHRHHERTALAKADGCVDCGYIEDLTKLSFHHLDPALKLRKVSSMVSATDANFYAEVAKCAVVCEPCHKRRHAAMKQHEIAESERASQSLSKRLECPSAQSRILSALGLTAPSQVH